MCRLIGSRQLSVFFFNSSLLFLSSLMMIVLHGNFYFRWSKAKWRYAHLLFITDFSANLMSHVRFAKLYSSSNAVWVFAWDSHGLFAVGCCVCVAFFAFLFSISADVSLFLKSIQLTKQWALLFLRYCFCYHRFRRRRCRCRCCWACIVLLWHSNLSSILCSTSPLTFRIWLWRLIMRALCIFILLL